MTPSKAIKIRCKDCQPEERTDTLCIDCALKNKSLSNLKKIKAYCLWCGNGQKNEVKLCTCTHCSLYPFRLGKNPNRKGIGNFKAQIPKNVS